MIVGNKDVEKKYIEVGVFTIFRGGFEILFLKTTNKFWKKFQVGRSFDSKNPYNP